MGNRAVKDNPSKAVSRPTRDQAVQEDRLDSRAGSKVGNRASRSRALVVRSSSKDSKVDKAAQVRVVQVRVVRAKVDKASQSSLASRAQVVRRSSKDSKADKVDLAKVDLAKAAPAKAALGKVARVESVRADLDKGAQVVRANPSSSASRVREVRNSNKDSKADKVDLAKAAPVKAAPDKGAQAPVDRASPSSSASRVLAARRDNRVSPDNRVFPDNKAFPSKVARGRKACPVRADPINSATEAQPLVRKADE